MTFLFEVLAFLLFLYILYRYVWRGGFKLSAAVEKRQQVIQRQLDEARTAKEELERTEAEYREALARTEAEAVRLREDAQAEGAAIVAELRQRAQEESERIRQRGEEQLVNERSAVVAQLRSEVGRLAVELAERLVREALRDEQRQARVVDRFLEHLPAESADPGDAARAATPVRAGAGGAP